MWGLQSGRKHGEREIFLTGFRFFLISESRVPPLRAMISGAASGSWAMGDPHSEQKSRQTALPELPVPCHFLTGPFMVNLSLGTTQTRAISHRRKKKLASQLKKKEREMDKKDHELAVRGKDAKTGKVANILFSLFSRPMPNVLCDVEGFLPAQKGGGGVMMFEAWSSIVFFFFLAG